MLPVAPSLSLTPPLAAPPTLGPPTLGPPTLGPPTLGPPTLGPPQPGGTIADCHDAEITPDTIIPPWYGERLDLDHAIYTCLANARTPEEKQRQRDQAADREVFRPRQWVVEPADWIQYLNEHTAAMS